jgi:signal transduction histidine kinase
MQSSKGWCDMDASLPDLRRRLAEETRRREAAERERDEFAGFALAGQAAAGLAHELNNLLNTVVLQASVLQLQVDEKFHPALEVIRRQANQSTGLLRTLSHVSGERAKSYYPVDLNRVIQEVLAEQPALAARVQWTPDGKSLPCFRGIDSAVKQLIRLLLSAACGDAPSPLRMRTCGEHDGVQIVIESDETSAEPIDGPGLWGRLGDLEQLAGQSLLRQLDGVLRVAPRPGGGFLLRVIWKKRENN